VRGFQGAFIEEAGPSRRFKCQLEMGLLDRCLILLLGWVATLVSLAAEILT